MQTTQVTLSRDLRELNLVKTQNGYRELNASAPEISESDVESLVNDYVIDVRDLRKNYGELKAVNGLDLQIGHGEVFALLGPNGAGKTTTVEILEGHRSRDSGEVSVLGFDPGKHEQAFKERIVDFSTLGMILDR